MKKSIWPRSLSMVLSMVMLLVIIPFTPANAVDKTGDDGITNWDFIEPVTHQKTVPNGYIGVYTAQDLNNVRNNLSGKFILMNDIDLSSLSNWEPIGDNETNSSDSRFTGAFDGNGFIIKNMIIKIKRSNTTYAGLFGYASGGNIKNIGIEQSEIFIDKQLISGNPTIEAYVGGIAGCSSSPIHNSYNMGSVIAKSTGSLSYVGGIAGYSGVISNCYNMGNISSWTDAGGIAGYSGTISNCYNMGNVFSDTGYVGGIAACSSNSSGSIKNSYNIGNIISYRANYYAGGIFGHPSGETIENCYYLNTISTAVGSGNGTLNNVKALSENEMKQKSSFTGFDFESVWDISLNINEGYPYLRAVLPPVDSAYTTITLSNSTYTGVIGEQIPISGTFSSLTTTPASITWSCSDPSAVTFGQLSVLGPNNNAIISILTTCNKVGTYAITAATADGKTASAILEISSGTNINLNQVSNIELYDTRTLTAAFTSKFTEPNDGTVTWECSDKTAVVFGRMSATGTKENASISIPITFIKKGTYTIKITCDGVTDSITVIVRTKDERLKIAAQDWENAWNNYLDTVKRQAEITLKRVEQSTKSTTQNGALAKASKNLTVVIPGASANELEAAKMGLLEIFVDNQYFTKKISLKSNSKDIDSLSVDIVKSVMMGYFNIPETAKEVTTKSGRYKITIDYGWSFTGVNQGQIKCENISKTGQTQKAGMFTSSTAEISGAVADFIREMNYLLIDTYEIALKEVISDLTGFKGINSFLKKKTNDFLVEKGFGDINNALGKGFGYYKYAKMAWSISSEYDATKWATEVVSESDKFIWNEDSLSNGYISRSIKELNKAKNEMKKAALSYLEGLEYKIPDRANVFNSFFMHSFKCPVDIFIYDKNGEEIGRIDEYDAVSFSDDILIFKDGDIKNVYSKKGTVVRFVIVGTDYGILNYTVEECIEGKRNGRLNFYNIELCEGKTLTADINMSSIEMVKDIFCINSNDEAIKADEFIKYREANPIQIRTQCDGNGYVTDGGVYIRGDAVSLIASANEGNIFVGWYAGETCITSKNRYEFTAMENIVLTAHFIEDNTVYIDVIEGDGGFVTGDGIYYKNEIIALTAIPDEGNTFDGWYENNAKISNATVYSFTATANRTLEARFIISTDFNYVVTNGNATITQYTGTASSIVVPSVIDGYPVTGIGAYAFSNIPNFTTNNLKRVTIPSNITSIGEYAFASVSLTEINVDNANANYCSEDGVLFNKSKTVLICYPAGRSNTTYLILDGVTDISRSSFAYCESLTRVNMPDSVASVNSYAFSVCVNLKEAYFLGNVPTNFGDGVFENTHSEFSIYCNPEKTGWTIPTWNGYKTTPISSSDFQYAITNGTATITGYVGNGGNVTISNTLGGYPVTSIGSLAFSNCESITGIIIPSSVDY